MCTLVAQSCQTLQTLARQAPLSMEFSRQEYCSGLPFPSPGALPDPGIEPQSTALQADSLPSEQPGIKKKKKRKTKDKIKMYSGRQKPRESGMEFTVKKILRAIFQEKEALRRKVSGTGT